jgi:hypothetical protein
MTYAAQAEACGYKNLHRRRPAEGHPKEPGGDCGVSGDGLAGIEQVLGFGFQVFGKLPGGTGVPPVRETD